MSASDGMLLHVWARSDARVCGAVWRVDQMETEPI